MFSRARQRSGNERWGRLVALGGLLVLGTGLAACAGKHHFSDAPPHAIAVEVINNLTIPTELTVFIVEDQGGGRRMLGTVPGAQTRTFSFTPLDWGRTYRLLAERQLARTIFSPRFTVSDAETATISWQAIPNMVQFYLPADTTSSPKS
jgi:hypothetical protein